MTASAAPLDRLFTARYHSTDGAAYPGRPFAGWTAAQAPDRPTTARVAGYSARLGVVPNPRRNRIERSRFVLRAELQAGDITNIGGQARPRAEVYYQGDKGYPGQLRYYAFSLRLGAFPPSPDGKLWTVLTQWKGDSGPEPPLALQAAAGRLKIVRTIGSVAKYPCVSNRRVLCTKFNGRTLQSWDLGPAPVNQWTHLIFQIRWNQTGAGRLCVRRDGHTAMCVKRMRTLQVFEPSGPGAADPIYLKQGIYRSNAWRATQQAYFGPMVIANNARSAGWKRRR